MNALKLQSINFGMPRISNQLKAMLPKHLTEEDIELLKQVETIYPDARMDIESGFGDPLDTQYTKRDELLSTLGIYYPIYRIIVKGKTGDTKLPEDGSFYIRGKLYDAHSHKKANPVPGHSSEVISSYGIKHRQIVPSDLEKAVDLYTKDINYIERLRNKAKKSKKI